MRGSFRAGGVPEIHEILIYFETDVNLSRPSLFNGFGEEFELGFDWLSAG